ncbi:DUF1405 domain-containing protein [Paenibacillus sp. CC-CFT747]|nr:DUF1405 domain-containing protein [Paenibacillus sp. CC-CFT747]
MKLSFYWSREFLTSPRFLWLLFTVNLLGTIYGYEWYGSQIAVTIEEKPLWMVFLVPDSPTASLFFTLSLLYLLGDTRRGSVRTGPLRRVVEAVGLVASFKYGIWAVVMIVAGARLGDPVGWQDWMLSLSHLGMAAETLLYFRFMTISPAAIGWAGVWVMLNDYVDYTFDIYPWLPDSLDPYVLIVRGFTVALSLFSIILFFLLWWAVCRKPSYLSPKDLP